MLKNGLRKAPGPIWAPGHLKCQSKTVLERPIWGAPQNQGPHFGPHFRTPVWTPCLDPISGPHVGPHCWKPFFKFEGFLQRVFKKHNIMDYTIWTPLLDPILDPSFGPYFRPHFWTETLGIYGNVQNAISNFGGPGGVSGESRRRLGVSWRPLGGF